LRQSLAHLERFDFVREAMAAGQLQLEAAWFSVPDTALYRWDGTAFTSLAGD
jgi:carbonic anhydrase